MHNDVSVISELTKGNNGQRVPAIKSAETILDYSWYGLLVGVLAVSGCVGSGVNI
jgi:hypothetical protein